MLPRTSSCWRPQREPSGPSDGLQRATPARRRVGPPRHPAAARAPPICVRTAAHVATRSHRAERSNTTCTVRVTLLHVRVAGVDVWKGRWIAISLSDGRFESSYVASSIVTLVEQLGEVDAIGVDIPIGLPPTGGARPCDRRAAAYVGPRRASVFSTACEELLGAASLHAANALARANAWPGISAQSYALRTRIFEVAGVAAEDDRFFEVHPEVSFTEANGGAPMLARKSSWMASSRDWTC